MTENIDRIFDRDQRINLIATKSEMIKNTGNNINNYVKKIKFLKFLNLFQSISVRKEEERKKRNQYMIVAGVIVAFLFMGFLFL